MAKDMLGNVMKVGQKVMFNGMVMTVTGLEENRVIGGHKVGNSRLQGMKIPDSLRLELELPFDADKPFNGVVCLEPPESGTSN